MYYCKSAKSSELLCTPPSTLGENLFLYKYEADDELQRSIKLGRTSIIKGKIEKLPPPWREKNFYFVLDTHNFIHLDDRLDITKTLRIVLRLTFHWRNVGRDAMPFKASDYWWPFIHRDVMVVVKACKGCQAEC